MVIGEPQESYVGEQLGILSWAEPFGLFWKGDAGEIGRKDVCTHAWGHRSHYQGTSLLGEGRLHMNGSLERKKVKLNNQRSIERNFFEVAR